MSHHLCLSSNLFSSNTRALKSSEFKSHSFPVNNKTDSNNNLTPCIVLPKEMFFLADFINAQRFPFYVLHHKKLKKAFFWKNCNIIFVWNFSENSSNLVLWPVPYTPRLLHDGLFPVRSDEIHLWGFEGFWQQYPALLVFLCCVSILKIFFSFYA